MRERFRSGISRECRPRDVTVALSGEGADELFGGYITYLADTYARRARIVPRGIRQLSLRSANRLRASNKKIGLRLQIAALSAWNVAG